MTIIDTSQLRDLDHETLDAFRRAAGDDDAANRFFDSTHQALISSGHYECNVPRELGGGGLGLYGTGRRQRLLAQYAPAPALASCMHLYWTGAAGDLSAMGIDGLAFVLRDAMAGEIFASGHAEAGNDLPVLLSTTAAEPVDGGYRISGRKHFGSLGPVWTRIGFHAMDSSGPDAPRIVHGFARRDDPGVHVIENWDTITMRASQSHDVVFDAVFVPHERIGAVVPAGSTDSPFLGAAFVWALALISNVYVGVAERSFELAVQAVSSRTSIALDDRSLAHNPMIQARIAEMWTALDGARTSLDLLAREWDERVDHGAEWGIKVFAAKQRVAEVVHRVTDDAMEIAGGSSIRSTNELARLWRDSRGVAFHPPTTAFAHEAIGKALLGIIPGGRRW